MFGEPVAFKVFENDTPVSPRTTYRGAYHWLQDRSGDGVAFAALRGKHDVYTVRQDLDEIDTDLLERRQLTRSMLNEHNGGFNPMSGDVVAYPCGTWHRIAEVIKDYDQDENGKIAKVQTSKGGSWHWGASGYMSMSGSLFRPIAAETLTWTIGEYAEVAAWFFHHGHSGAGRDVNVTAKVRVWHTTAELPSC